MEMQNVIYTETIKLGKRTYYFDLKQGKFDNQYLIITQTRKMDDGSEDRQRLILFQDDLEAFGQAMLSSMIQFQAKKKKRINYTDQEKNEIRKSFPRAFYPWTEEEDNDLKALFDKGIPVAEMVPKMMRKDTAITSRLRTLGLLEPYSAVA